MRRSRVLAAVLCLAGAILPFTRFVPDWTPGLATVAYLNALAILGLNLLFGVTGMLAFGQAAFMAVPVYCAGILDDLGVPFFVAVAIGLAVTLALAKLTGHVFVRLPGVYLAVGTIGFGYVIEGVARAFPSISGGASGLVLARGRSIDDQTWYLIALAALVAGMVVYWWLVRGAFWRRLRTIHHDELAAAVVGINVGSRKEQVFMIGAAYAAVAGILKAYYVGVVIPEDAGVDRSMEQLAMAMLGGPEYLFGALFGTAALQWLFVITGYTQHYVLLVYGAVFLAAVLYVKEGIAGLVATAWRKVEAAVDGPPSPPKPAQFEMRPILANNNLKRSGACLTVSAVSKRFHGVQALEGISFCVDFGEIFTIVGPNGAGKSTLFNIVSGIERPTAGAICLVDKDMASLSISDRASFVGRSFQVARLVPDLTVIENVMVRLDQIAAEVSEEQRRTLAYEQIAAFGLSEFADTLTNKLSAGQHKLVDLTRAAVGDPPLVLLDEPAVGLTAGELDHLKSLLLKLKACGSAIVIVEHNIEFVAEVATRGIVLDGGRPIALGPIRQILADPKVREAYFGALQ